MSGNLKLDETSLRKIFLYNLNQIFFVLLHLADRLPLMAKETCYGDLQNVVEELLSEVLDHIYRLDNIFTELKEAPAARNTCSDKKIAYFLTQDDEDEQLDNLSKDLSLVFHLQKIMAVKCNYYFVLRSISNSFNNINIKQNLQYSCDECERNISMFRLIAKEYMETSINKFLR